MMTSNTCHFADPELDWRQHLMMNESFAKDADEFFERGLSGSNMMGIFRGLPTDETLRLCKLAWDQGVDLVEIPMQSAESRETLAAVIAEGKSRGKLVGAGTIMNPEHVRAAADLGARFCVSPGLDIAVSEACEDAGVFHLPGVATASEITRALSHGHTWLKAFPASVLGADWIKAMKGPFPQVKLVCTGGMSPATMHDYISAGARAVAIGGLWAS
jgi:Entner-Doudoroff aldolase